MGCIARVVGRDFSHSLQNFTMGAHLVFKIKVLLYLHSPLNSHMSPPATIQTLVSETSSPAE